MGAERQWQIAVRVSLAIFAVLVAILAGTGVLLAVHYQPDITTAFPGASHGHGLASARGVHQLAAWLMLPAMVAVAVTAITLFVVRRDRGLIALPIILGILVVTVAFTGLFLPWDQLALRSVTVGARYRGYGAILRGHNVKYVIIGHTEVASRTIARWFWAHTLLLPLCIAGLSIAIAILARTRTSVVDEELDQHVKV